MFIGREEELSFLNERYSSPDGQLVVIYGRRRIGKTETLREFCKTRKSVFFSCRECSDRLQLQAFSQKMLSNNIPASQYITEFTDWEQALRSVADLPFGEEKRLLVIDEFPYMCKGNPSIPSVLQSLWDEYLKNENVMIILCGSSMSFIEKELLSEKNPLYGRATGIYKMKEMDFYDAAKFFPDYSDIDKVLAYSVLGGVPHYLKQFDPSLSISDNIKKYILRKGAVLYSEVEFLLRQELRETHMYNSIIEAIALGSTKLNEISQRALIDDTVKTSVYLKNLMELGIVEREFSISAGDREKANPGRGRYRITDNFFRFWYAFVFTNYSDLENGDIDGVYEYMIRPDLHKFASYSFEDICRQYIQKQQKNGKLPFRYSKAGRWFGKTTVREKDRYIAAETEIDILAVSRSADKYLVGECKFKNRPFSYSEFLDTVAKLQSEKGKAEFYYMLFSESGFDDKVISETSVNEKVILRTLADVVNSQC